MKICAACCEELPKESFSKKQWQLKQHQRRCKECIETNRDVQLKAPSKNDTAAGIRNPPPPCAADNEGVSCWICLEEGPDELGKPLVRDCACHGESAGFAHLSCIIQYAKGKSWSAFPSTPHLARGKTMMIIDFTRAWQICPNCNQMYNKELALDLATAFLIFAESNNYQGFPRVEASSMKIQALMALGKMKESRKIANKMLSFLGKLKRTGSLSSTSLRIEARTHCQLGHINAAEGTKESVKIAIKDYESSRDIYKSIDFKQGIDASEASLAMAELAHDKASMDVVSRKELAVWQNRYKRLLEQSGEKSPATIGAGLNTAIRLHIAHHSIKSERLLSKIARVSNRVHGLDHELSQEVELMLQYCKVRYVYMKTKWDVLLFKALRYENNGEKCIINGPLRWLSSPGNVAEEETTTFATKNIILSEGTPVICHGLIKSNHLNGKLGDIRSVDEEKTGHYEVHFEDEGLKPRLIKPKNVRILFELPDIKSSGILQI
mmetsp:Transcript_30891/g.65290  ORF Transcript_30891/g.65290 Transcript_30891/m.65290 type:complete len:494 (-) Transcript_30891:143-1624(-)